VWGFVLHSVRSEKFRLAGLLFLFSSLFVITWLFYLRILTGRSTYVLLAIFSTWILLIRWRPEAGKVSLLDVAWNQGEQKLAVLRLLPTGHRRLEVHDSAKTGSPLYLYYGRRQLQAITWINEEELMVAIQGGLELWNVTLSSQIRTIALEVSAPSTALEADPTGAFVAVASGDQLYVVEIESGSFTWERRFEQNIEALFWLGCDEIGVGFRDRLKIVSSDTGKKIATKRFGKSLQSFNPANSINVIIEPGFAHEQARAPPTSDTHLLRWNSGDSLMVANTRRFELWKYDNQQLDLELTMEL